MLKTIRTSDIVVVAGVGLIFIYRFSTGFGGGIPLNLIYYVTTLLFLVFTALLVRPREKNDPYPIIPYLGGTGGLVTALAAYQLESDTTHLIFIYIPVFALAVIRAVNSNRSAEDGSGDTVCYYSLAILLMAEILLLKPMTGG